MSNRKEHNRECESKGIDKEICNKINSWMDEPSQQHPGCSHRNYRHNKEDCDYLSEKIFKEYIDQGEEIAEHKSQQAYEACQKHRELDKKEENCGCKALYS